MGTTFRVMLSVVEKNYPQMDADRRRLKADQDLQDERIGRIKATTERNAD